LCSQVRDDAGRHLRRIGQKRTQESGGNDLQRQTEAVVVAAPLGEELAIDVIEMEVTRELSGSWFAGVATVAALLVFGQEIDGYGGACHERGRKARILPPNRAFPVVARGVTDCISGAHQARPSRVSTDR
jgi:hypothetical protein